jgi:hypothetical protein
VADDEWKKAQEGWDAAKRASGAIPPLPQKDPKDALSILAENARQAFLKASRSGGLDQHLARNHISLPRWRISAPSPLRRQQLRQHQGPPKRIRKSALRSCVGMARVRQCISNQVLSI